MEAEQLHAAIEQLHSCRAELRAAVPVKEEFEGRLVWEGVVNVFDIKEQQNATICYAWSSTAEDSNKRRFYAVLKIPVDSPEAAVRAAIVCRSEGWSISLSSAPTEIGHYPTAAERVRGQSNRGG